MNGAELDPFEGRRLYEPRTELQGEYIEHEFEHVLDDYVASLTEQEYCPFQQIIPDTQTGFDSSGDYHAIEHFTAEALNNAITPHRWADYLQDALNSYISTFDYTVGASERDDIVQDIVSERMENLDSMLERYQLEKALEIWRTSYGRGYRIRE